MAKKSSASSRPEKLKSVTSEDIKNRQWTEKECEVVRRLGKSQADGDDSDINFEDIPPLTHEHLARMARFRDRKKVPNDIPPNLMEAERRAG
jgi:hypothetical protein